MSLRVTLRVRFDGVLDVFVMDGPRAEFVECSLFVHSNAFQYREPSAG